MPLYLSDVVKGVITSALLEWQIAFIAVAVVVFSRKGNVTSRLKKRIFFSSSYS
jgi:hypothetical protein